MEFVQQVAAQIPWGHNIVLLTKLKDQSARLAYAAATVELGWSRKVLVMQIEARTIERQGKAVTNFDRTLPSPQSDRARETLKDPYKLDFLGLEADAREREIEQALVDHVADFLIEIKAGKFKLNHVGQLGFYATAVDAKVTHADNRTDRALAG